MSYVNGITYIDELPLVQIPSNNNGANYNNLNNYNTSSNFRVREDPYYKANPYDEGGINYPDMGNAPAANRFANYPPPSRNYPPPPQANDYYEEVVKAHPSIQSKIRQTDRYSQQDAIMGEPIPSFSNGVLPPIGMRFNSQSSGSVAGNYDVIGQQTPSGLDQNLALVQNNIPLQYNRPFAQASGNIIYPVVEHNDNDVNLKDESSSSGNNKISCEQCQQHGQSCSNCQMHRKFYYLLFCILIFILLIFLVMCFLLYKIVGSSPQPRFYTTITPPHMIQQPVLK
jgi:hypothetical protein